MWLPRPIYEAIPYAGIGLGALLWMKRRDYRSTQADYDPRAIDE